MVSVLLLCCLSAFALPTSTPVFVRKHSSGSVIEPQIIIPTVISLTQPNPSFHAALLHYHAVCDQIKTIGSGIKRADSEPWKAALNATRWLELCEAQRTTKELRALYPKIMGRILKHTIRPFPRILRLLRFALTSQKLGGQYTEDILRYVQIIERDHRLYKVTCDQLNRLLGECQVKRGKRFVFALVGGLIAGAVVGGVVGGAVGSALGSSEGEGLSSALKGEMSTIRRTLRLQNSALESFKGIAVQLSNNINTLQENQHQQSQNLRAVQSDLSDAIKALEKHEGKTTQQLITGIRTNWLITKLDTLVTLILSMDNEHKRNLAVGQDFEHGNLNFDELRWRTHLTRIKRVAAKLRRPVQDYLTPSEMSWSFLGRETHMHPTIQLMTWVIGGIRRPIRYLRSPPILHQGVLLTSEVVTAVTVGNKSCLFDEVKNFCTHLLSKTFLCTADPECETPQCLKSYLVDSRVGCDVTEHPTNQTCFTEFAPGGFAYTSGFCPIETRCPNSTSTRVVLRGEHLIRIGRCPTRFGKTWTIETQRSHAEPVSFDTVMWPLRAIKHLRPILTRKIDLRLRTIRSLTRIKTSRKWEKELDVTLRTAASESDKIGSYISKVHPDLNFLTKLFGGATGIVLWVLMCVTFVLSTFSFSMSFMIWKKTRPKPAAQSEYVTLSDVDSEGSVEHLSA